jgi:hypothetical protein
MGKVNYKNLITPDCSKMVSFKKYKKEIKDSKIILSPFGWGEICTRDYEAFLVGALLVKPSMSHLITYPNFYQENVTYVPIDWSLDGTSTVLGNIVQNYESYLRVAMAGQNLLKFYYSKQGKKEFVDHLIDEIG